MLLSSAEQKLVASRVWLGQKHTNCWVSIKKTNSTYAGQDDWEVGMLDSQHGQNRVYLLEYPEPYRYALISSANKSHGICVTITPTLELRIS